MLIDIVFQKCCHPIFAGQKRYEVTNHLGNVLAVITDRKHGKAESGSDIQWFEADLVASQQYYPFGMLMPKDASASIRRQYSVDGYDYRFGFNGKEGDDEVKGDDNQQDYGMWIYDPRAGRFLSVDPIAREYPWYTPYQFAGNMPIKFIDLDGLEPENNPKDYNGNAESAGIAVASRILSHAAQNNSRKNRSTPYEKQKLIGENVQGGTNNYVTDTDIGSAKMLNMFVNSQYSMNVDESNASDFQDYEAFVVYELMSNFVSGYGPQNYDFPTNGIISSQFKGSEVLDKALRDFRAGKHPNEGKQYGFGFGDLIKDTWDNGTVFNITGFVGSAHITITPSDDNSLLNIDIFNVTSLTSGSLGKELFSPKSWPKSYVRDPQSSSSTQYGNISQRFHLQIPNDGN